MGYSSGLINAVIYFYTIHTHIIVNKVIFKKIHCTCIYIYKEAFKIET